MTDEPKTSRCTHCSNGCFDGTDVGCVNGVLIDIDVAHEGWQRDVEYPAGPCISQSGKWPKRDRGCQARLAEWAATGEPTKTTDLDGMRHAADEDDGHWHSLQATYLRDGADEIERLRAERDKFETAWQDVSDRYETLLNQLGATDA